MIRSHLVSLVLCVLAAPSAWSQVPQFAEYETRLDGSIPLQNGYYGRNVSLSGDTLAVGMPARAIRKKSEGVKKDDSR